MNTSSTDRGSVALRTARWSATHPWRALLVWVTFVAAAVATGSFISTQATTDADYRLGQSGRADQIVADAGLDAPDTENVLITRRPVSSTPPRRRPRRSTYAGRCPTSPASRRWAGRSGPRTVTRC